MNIQSLLQAAHAQESAGDIRRAAQLCVQVLNLDSSNVTALLLLGSIAARQGRGPEAVELLKRAHQLDPAAYDAARWLATLLIGRDGGQEAVRYGRIAVELRPNEAESHVALGLAAMGAGDGTLAIESLSRAIEINPAMAGAHHNLGVLYAREESYEDAIESFRRAVELAPEVAEFHLHLGRCYLAEDMGDEALQCAERALEIKPDSTDARRLFADARFTAFHGESGLERIRAALAEQPDAPFPNALMGSRLQEMGEFAEAENYALKSIELQPIQGFAYYIWAHNRKIREEDRPVMSRVEQAAPTSELIPEESQYLHFGLGKAYDDLGDYEQAMRHFDLAHDSSDGGTSPASPGRAKVHPMAQAFSKEVIDRFADLGTDSEEPIFIFGMPRSGTTLLEQILSRHPRVGGAGELFFWRDNSRRIVNLRDSAFRPSDLVKSGRRYLDLLHTKAPGKDRVTDKFPSNYTYLGLLQILYPKAIFINARRHPFDVCLSIYMRPFVTNQGIGRNRQEIVDTFRIYRATMQHWREILGPDRFIEVDYEQLVQHPEEMTRDIIARCRLEWDDACLHPEEGDRRVVTFSKWQVRQPVYTTSVERWRRYEPWLGVFKDLLEDA